MYSTDIKQSIANIKQRIANKKQLLFEVNILLGLYQNIKY